MGKGKVLLLHLLAVVAGWGMVAGLRPVVGSWEPGGKASAESRAPSKTGRIRSTAEIAAGQKLLQSFTAARQGGHRGGFDATSGPKPALRDLVDEYRKDSGFDPAVPAPSWDIEGQSEEDRSATIKERSKIIKYYLNLHRLLGTYFEGEHGPDPTHAFLLGRLDAGAIYDSLAAHLPGAAADHTLRRALYDRLAPLDPVRAAALLTPLSEDEAAQWKRDLFASRSTSFAPETAFALLSSTPPSGDPVEGEMRVAAWNLATREFLERYSSDYLPWVEQYPAGPDREEAAAALLRRLEKDDLPGYRRIRALVTDPQTLASFPPR
jgi:hypothetical protein